MPRIERVGMLVGRQEFLDLARVWQIDVTCDVRNKEAILTDHLGQEHARILTDSIGHQVIVEDFLGVARPAHQPPYVARRYARNRNRRADRACDRRSSSAPAYDSPRSVNKARRRTARRPWSCQ